MRNIELFGQIIDIDNLQSVYLNGDCTIGMKQFPDEYFDLAVVDPPYGNGGGDFKRSDKSRFGGRFDNYKILDPEATDSFKDKRGRHMGGGHGTKYVHTAEDDKEERAKNLILWDQAPDENYFNELFRVSKNQIIWGGNYFSLPPTRCFLVWYKTNIPEHFSMSMCEYAWCSFNDNAKLFKFSSGSQKERFHPTAKPIELYSWIYNLYTKPGMRILDTHVGSASSLIAARDAGLTYIGFELNEYYYKLSKERLDRHNAQMNLYDFGLENK